MTRALSPDDLAERFHAIFAVDVRGREVLAYLERKYCTATPVVTTGGIDAVLQTYQRAAHRELLDHIHTMIARATADPTETPIATT